MSKMKKEFFLELVTKKLSNEATLEEIAQLESLLEKDEYKELYEWIIDRVKSREQGNNKSFYLDRGLTSLTKKIKERESSFSWKTNKAPSFKHHTSILKMAASITLLIVGTFYLLSYFNSSSKQLVLNEKSTLAGQKSILTLFDGTKITLNANSKLKYPTHFGETSREVYLEGEAYFEVVHNSYKPFVVHTNKIATTVLGTKFNVCAFPEEESIAISLVEGKVTVSEIMNSKSENKVTLAPKEQFIYSKLTSKAEVKEFDFTKVIGWKDNSFVFENEPLGNVLRKLERAFGVGFELSAQNKDYRLKANIKNESFWGVVETIKYATGLDYEVVSDNDEIEKVIFVEKK